MHDLQAVGIGRHIQLHFKGDGLQSVLRRQAGIGQVDDVLQHVDGAMIGREAYQHPYFLAELEKHRNPSWQLPDRRDIVVRMIPYIEEQLAQGEKLGRITRHMLGLFVGQPGARAWRRYLSENAFKEEAGIEIVMAALEAMPNAA